MGSGPPNGPKNWLETSKAVLTESSNKKKTTSALNLETFLFLIGLKSNNASGQQREEPLCLMFSSNLVQQNIMVMFYVSVLCFGFVFR